MSDLRRLLVCLRWGIGDLVMQTPALEGLRAAFPEATLCAVGAEPATQLLNGDARVDRVFRYQDFGLGHYGAVGDGGRRRRVVRWLRRQRFDLILDAHVAPPGFAGPVWERGGPLLSADPGAEEAAARSGGDAVAALSEGVRAGWGVAVPAGRRPSLRPGAGARAFARSWLAPLAGRGAPIAVAPSAGSPLKQWPVDRFAAAVGSVAAARGSPVVVLAAPGDDAARRLAAALESVAPLLVLPPSHLLRTAAVLERCGALLSNDTGVMHVARAGGVPIASVFGPTAPGVYFPGGPADRAVGRELGCPCRNRWSLAPSDCCRVGECRVGLRSCIDRVDVREVVEALRDVAGAARTPPAEPDGPLRSGGARTLRGAPAGRPRRGPAARARSRRSSP